MRLLKVRRDCCRLLSSFPGVWRSGFHSWRERPTKRLVGGRHHVMVMARCSVCRKCGATEIWKREKISGFVLLLVRDIRRVGYDAYRAEKKNYTFVAHMRSGPVNEHYVIIGTLCGFIISGIRKARELWYVSSCALHNRDHKFNHCPKIPNFVRGTHFSFISYNCKRIMVHAILFTALLTRLAQP